MFSDMKPAERKLLEACQKGEILDLGNKSPTEKTAKNEIRGEFLRALILSNNQEIEESGKKYVLKIAPNGIIFSRVYVSGIFDFSFCSTDLKFSFRNSKFENRLDLSDSKIRFLSLIGSIVPSFDAFRLVCESDIFLKNGFEAHGKVNFGSAQIGGILSCINGKFINEKGDALNCNSAKIDGAVFLKDGFEAHGKVNFGSAQIGSNLECSKGKFINKEGDALNCNSVKIGGSVFLRDGFEAEGKVNFGLAQIENNLDCTKGKFINENNDALNCDKVKIGGSVFLKDGFEAEGKVNFASAQIAGSLNCRRGKITNEKGDTLNCNGVIIEGNVFLIDGFNSKGKVNFILAQIGSNLECTNGKFINEKEDALNCNKVKIGGSVYLNNNFEAKGKVNFGSAEISGSFFCMKGKIINDKEDALICYRAKIYGDIFFNNGFEIKGNLSLSSTEIKKSLVFSKLNITGNCILTSAKIDTIKESDNFWKKSEFKEFHLDGLEYNHLSGKNLDSSTLEKWLDKMPEFKPQPYKQLAKVLRNMGHNNEADDIMIEYNNITTSKSENWFIKKLKQIYGITAGYGYKPMRVLGTMFTIWFFCSLFYLYASQVAIFAPSDTLVFQNLKYKSSINKCGVPLKNFNWSEIYYHNSNDDKCIELKMNNIEPEQKSNKTQNWTTNENLEGEYTTFSPYWYSLDIILPIVDLQMDKDWGVFISPINSDITLNHVTRWIVWIEILFGWIYSLILVAILSGLAKNEKD